MTGKERIKRCVSWANIKTNDLLILTDTCTFRNTDLKTVLSCSNSISAKQFFDLNKANTKRLLMPE